MKNAVVFLLLTAVIAVAGTPDPFPVVPDPMPLAIESPAPKATLATHSHRCVACGTVFAHGDDSYGNAEAHKCPKCGYGPNWEIYQRFAQPSTTPNCPT